MTDRESLAAVEAIVAHVMALYEGRDPAAVDAVSQLAEVRRIFFAGACVGGRAPKIAETTRVIPVVRGALAGEWVLPVSGDPARRLLYIHGGGWVSGHPADYRHVAEALAAALGAVAFAVDYRLAPEFPWPAAPDDCLAAWRYISTCGPQGEGSARALWASGDSAGGNLCLALLQDLKARGGPLPDAVAVFGAVADMAFATPSINGGVTDDPFIAKAGLEGFRALYLPPGAELADPRISPLQGVLAGLPPTLLHAGARETLRDDSLLYAERARTAGSLAEAKVWPGMTHAFEWWSHVLPDARRSLDEAAAFLRRHAGGT